MKMASIAAAALLALWACQAYAGFAIFQVQDTSGCSNVLTISDCTSVLTTGSGDNLTP